MKAVDQSEHKKTRTKGGRVAAYCMGEALDIDAVSEFLDRKKHLDKSAW